MPFYDKKHKYNLFAAIRMMAMTAHKSIVGMQIPGVKQIFTRSNHIV